VRQDCDIGTTSKVNLTRQNCHNTLLSMAMNVVVVLGVVVNFQLPKTF